MAYDLITALSIAAPHILYALIWYQPYIWRVQFKRESVNIFAQVATALKGMFLTGNFYRYCRLETCM